jgi:hypothetical protein
MDCGRPSRLSAEEEIMEFYSVHIPIGTRVAGATANGGSTCVLPGEYLVHRLFPKLPTQLSPVLRFVGADPAGRDVHVALGALCNLPASLGVSVVRVEDENELYEPA